MSSTSQVNNPPAYLIPYLRDIAGLAQQQFYGGLGINPQIQQSVQQQIQQQAQQPEQQFAVGPYISQPNVNPEQQFAVGPYISQPNVNSASNLFPKQTYFPDSTVVPFSPETETALALQRQRALNGSPLIDAAQNQVERGINGFVNPNNRFLSPIASGINNPALTNASNLSYAVNPAQRAAQGLLGGNPFFQSVLNKQDNVSGLLSPIAQGVNPVSVSNPRRTDTSLLEQTAKGDFTGFNNALQAGIDKSLPVINSVFGRGGRFGSGLQQEAIASAVGREFAGLYGQERNRQLQAQKTLADISGRDNAQLLQSEALRGQLSDSALGRQLQATGLLSGTGSDLLGKQLQAASLQGNQQLQATGLLGDIAGQNIGQRIQATGLAGDIFNQGINQRLRAAGLLNQDYQNERNRQLQAAQIAPQLAQQDYMDINQLANVGNTKESLDAMRLQEQIDRFNFAQQTPGNLLSQYAALVNGNGALPFGTSTSNRARSGSLQSALGAGLGTAALTSNPLLIGGASLLGSGLLG